MVFSSIIFLWVLLPCILLLYYAVSYTHLTLPTNSLV